MSPEELYTRMAQRDPVVVLDVRTANQAAVAIRSALAHVPSEGHVPLRARLSIAALRRLDWP